MHLDADRCYRAVASRDARFDGWFVMAVRTTGIYCRPSCPARTPQRRNVEFHATAASAHAGGFRACKRCRPDAAPGSPDWDVRADVVARVMRLIADGVVDRDGVPGLARRLGYSTRHLARLVTGELGVSPLALARARRADTARILLETTPLPVAEVAFAAGFTSIRQCNETIRDVHAATPTDLRRGRGRGAQQGGHHPRHRGAISIDLRLAHRMPYAARPVLLRLARHAVPGVEEVDGGTVRRTLTLPHGGAVVALTPRADHVECRLRLEDLRDLTPAVQRCRRLLDLDADPLAVDAALAEDPRLARAIAARPGLRVTRAIDAQEAAVRAVVSQQVGVAAARSLIGRLVALAGVPLDVRDGGLTHRFPGAAAIADADLTAVGLPRARAATLRALTSALAEGAVDLSAGADRRDARSRLLAIPGVGPWTADIIAIRAIGDPDVLPAGDVAIRRGAARLGLPDDAAALAAVAARWSPWRSYAAAHLWAAAMAPVTSPRPTPAGAAA